MVTVSASIIVERPVEEIFAFVADARNNPLWQSTSGLRETRQLPESPVGVGTQITETWHFMGVTAHSTCEVTEYEPSSRYARHLLSGPSPITHGTQIFEPLAEGTRWTSTVLVQADGAFPVAEAVLAAELKRALEAGMAEAKALLERRMVDNAR
ncbi:MAG TPA: SRPBCC family protein [Ktedonobacterales bacterium]|nr:SRPBCC family protein [Ktedonobacterales bacterium]